MSISAMKQALEALEEVQKYDKTSEWFDKKVSALRQAIAEAEKQEPVVGTKTWFEDGKVVTQHLYDSDISQERVDETAKDQHELAGTIPISNGGIATSTPTDFFAPPKREWVGLTEQDVHDAFQFTELVKQLSFDRERPEWCENFAAYLEAKLKEKNCG